MILYFTAIASLFLVSTTVTSNKNIDSDADLPSAGVKFVCSASVLTRHNVYRAKHHSPLLTYDPAIATVAQAWADKLAASGEMNHSGNAKYGENINVGERLVDQGAFVDRWYSEEAHYAHNYNSEPDEVIREQTQHFTQLVWKSTASFGCGCADYQKGDFQQVIVCNYQPPGNVKGQYMKNVFPPYVN